MKKAVVTTVAALALSFVIGGNYASAHQHVLSNPSGNEVLLPVEQTHGVDYTNGKLANNPYVTEAQLESLGIHPMHYFVHKGPRSESSPVEVSVAN